MFRPSRAGSNDDIDEYSPITIDADPPGSEDEGACTRSPSDSYAQGTACLHGSLLFPTNGITTGKAFVQLGDKIHVMRATRSHVVV